jgi:hypothetical protein
MTGIDDPQVIAEGFMLYDTCFSPWSMDVLEESNELRLDGDRLRMKFFDNKFWVG